MKCFWGKKYKTIDEMIEGCNRDPHRIGAWILRSIWYKSDMEAHGIKQHTQTPQEVFDTRGDDCEGFCTLLQECLKRIGIKSTMIGVWEVIRILSNVWAKYGPGHAILCFKLDDGWYQFSNWGKKKCRNAVEIKDIPPTIYKKGKWCELVAKEGKLINGVYHAYGRTKKT